MSDTTPHEVLAPYAHRRIAAFLSAMERKDRQCLPDEAHAAFWSVVYADRAEIEFDLAVACERELLESGRTVGDLLNGWRPKVLKTA